MDHLRRNQVLRGFFAGKDWETNKEFQLKRELVLKSRTLLPTYRFLIEDEWEFGPEHGHAGRGDLVFYDGVFNYAVVEVKYIDLDGTGKKVRRRRTSRRREVEEQAQKYAQALFARYDIQWGHVAAYTYTNESQLQRVDVWQRAHSFAHLLL